MKRVKLLLKGMDNFQQQRPVLAFPIAVWKKFGDDQAGSLAALIAYYAFASIFPLLLVLITVLGVVLRNHPALQTRVLNDVAHNFPGIGSLLTGSVHAKSGTGIALAIGLIFAFIGGRGVATAIQNALNAVWEVPLTRRPGFPGSILRSLGMILVIGIGEIVSFTLAGFAGGVGTVFTGVGAYIATTAVSLILNVGVFWLAFRLGTAAEVAGRDLWLGAVLSAIAWQVLQSVGAGLIRHAAHTSNTTNATFALVLGLLAFLYLQAELTLYAVEASAVHARRLWPRSMFPPPLTEADRRAYELYAKVQQRRPEQEIESRLPEADDSGPSAKPDADRAGR
jgi:YihY family inner membrane protein